MYECWIREATPEDLPGIARVRVDTWRATYRGMVPDDFLDALSKLIVRLLLQPALALPEGVQLICREDKTERLLGALSMHELDVVLADTPMGPGVSVRAFNHLLGECGIVFFAARKLAPPYRRRFPQTLNGAPLLLPAANTAVRGALMQWLDRRDIRPRVVGEFDDSALMKAFGQAGAGVFAPRA